MKEPVKRVNKRPQNLRSKQSKEKLKKLAKHRSRHDGRPS